MLLIGKAGRNMIKLNRTKTANLIFIFFFAAALFLSWAICIRENLLVMPQPMDLIKFGFFQVPALLILTVGFLYFIITVIHRRHKNMFILKDKKQILILTVFFLVFAILMISPVFMGSRFNNDVKNILDTLSIENSLNNDYIFQDEQYYGPKFDSSKFGDVMYISAYYDTDMSRGISADNDSSDKSLTSLEYELRYMQNVPRMFYRIEKSIFSSLYKNDIRFFGGYKEDYEFTDNDINYQVYYTINDEGDKNHISIFADSGDSLLTYRLEFTDESQNLRIDKEYVLSLIKGVLI